MTENPMDEHQTLDEYLAPYRSLQYDHQLGSAVIECAIQGRFAGEANEIIEQGAAGSNLVIPFDSAATMLLKALRECCSFSLHDGTLLRSALDRDSSARIEHWVVTTLNGHITHPNVEKALCLALLGTLWGKQ